MNDSLASEAIVEARNGLHGLEPRVARALAARVPRDDYMENFRAWFGAFWSEVAIQSLARALALIERDEWGAFCQDVLNVAQIRTRKAQRLAASPTKGKMFAWIDEAYHKAGGDHASADG